MQRRILGRVISGSVNTGVSVLVEKGEVIEDFPLGSIVTINGKKHKYLAMITNSGLDVSESYVASLMGSDIPKRIRDITVEASRDNISSKWIELALVAQSRGGETKIADTFPSFYSEIVETSEEEIRHFYGYEDRRVKWNIGVPKTPRAISVEVPLDVEKLIELSFGIFGKSGTGKTFLGNIIAGYILLYDMQKSRASPYSKRIRMLIFDMHSEYGLELRDNMGNPIADGVGKIFSTMFKRYTPDVELARTRGLHELRINYNELTIEDLRLICPILGITPTFVAHLSDYEKYLRKLLGDYWVWGLIIDEYISKKLQRTEEGRKILMEIQQRTRKNDFSALRNEILSGIKSIGVALYTSFVSQTSKLKVLADYPYTSGKSAIDDIVENLVSRDGLNIIISLGKYEKETPLYMIIANLIARRLREKILEKSMRGEEIETKIVIFLEEAHNFLGKETYRQSPFGAIAREMRKKGVMLCVIDQKPSELDRDVVSMLWTNFVFTLTDRNDIDAALLGIPRPDLFRKVVPVMGRREVLIFGEAINFPVVILVKDYRAVAEYFKEITGEVERDIDRRESLARADGFI